MYQLCYQENDESARVDVVSDEPLDKLTPSLDDKAQGADSKCDVCHLPFPTMEAMREHRKTTHGKRFQVYFIVFYRSSKEGQDKFLVYALKPLQSKFQF